MRLAGPDPARFVAENTTLQSVSFVPEIRLGQAGDAHDLWHRTEAELQASGLAPPFWAFAWAGGQALARHILDHPDLVRDKRVVDFAAGSGLVAIAAAKSGAAEVVANDIDPFSEAAIARNAEANHVAIGFDGTDRIAEDLDCDILLSGDVFYDRTLERRLTPWFDDLARSGRDILVGDPMRSYLPQSRMTPLAIYEMPVDPALEDAATKAAGVFRWRPPA